VIRKKPCLS